jgi:ACT domain-containing protein
MKITKEKLNKIIKEEIEKTLEEGVFSRMFSKLGVESKETFRALNSYEVWMQSTDKRARKLAHDASYAPAVEEYLKVKKELAEKRAAAADSVKKHGANKSQLYKFQELERQYKHFQKIKMLEADESIAEQEEYQAELAAAKQAEEEAEKRASEIRQAHYAWKAEQAAAAKGGSSGKDADRRCREEHRSDLRRGYDEGYRKCVERAREFAAQQSSRYEE